MIQDALNIIIPLAWVILIVAALTKVLSVARKSGRLVPALRILVSYRSLIYTLGISSLTLIKASLVFIYPQEAGVVVSVFSDEGVRRQPLRGGLHWIVPLAERLIVYPMYWQTYEMTSRPSTDSSGLTVFARTLDGQQVSLDSTVIFRIDPEQLVSLHVQWQERYLGDFVHPVLRGTLRDEVSRYTAEALNSVDRMALIEGLERRLRQVGRENGLIVHAFLLRDLAFLKGYASTVEAKQIALQKQTTRQFQAQRIAILAQGQEQRIKLLARARAQALLAKADARKKAVVIRKQADAKALSLVKGALKTYPHMLTYRYIDELSLDRAVIIVKNGKSSVVSR